MKRVLHPFAPLSLRAKLILSYLLLLLLPMTLLGGVSFTIIESLLMEQSQNAYQETARQTALNISNRMENYLVSANAVRSNEQLQRAMRILRIRGLSLGEEYDTYKQLQTVKNSILHQQGIVRVRLATMGQATFISDWFEILSLDSLRADAAFAEISGRVSWVRSDHFSPMRVDSPTSIQLCVEVTDTYSTLTLLGYLLIEIDRAALFAPLDALTLPENGVVMLHDGQEALHLVGNSPEGAAELQSTLSALRQEDRYLLIEAPVSEQWTLSMGIPRSDLLRSGEGLPRTILWMAVLLSAIGIAFAFAITHSINKRLQMTLQGIQRMETGELGFAIPVIGEDEYSRMQAAFNRLSMRMHQLIEDLMASQAHQKQTEMRLLYEQINPHFVYNTLDIIRWEAIRNKAFPLAELSDMLVGYLRQSLNHGQEMIEVAREIDMLDRYMHIMNFRYQDAIAYETEIETGILGIKIIKLILQPLVENAVLHGIMGTAEKKGSILVQGWQEGDTLLFVVADDGAGMDADQLKALPSAGMEHYGLWNVRQRVEAFYGPGSGLSIHSAPGEGTRITVTLGDAMKRQDL